MRRWTGAPAPDDPPPPAAAPPNGGYREGPAQRRASSPPAAAGRPMRDRLVGFALLVACGIGIASGQAPWGLWPVALGAWVGAFWIVAHARWPVLAAWLLGTAHFATALHWIAEPFLVDAVATGALAPVAVVAAATGLSLFWALGAGLGARAGGAPGAAVGLALGELARSWLFTGFPWALPGHVLIDTPALPAAAVIGQHGLTLAVLGGAGLIAALRPVPVVAGAMLWAVPFGVAAPMTAAPPPAPDAPVVRLVQPNAPQHLKWDPDWIGTFFRRGLELTAQAGDVDAVVWPETALPALLGDSADLRERVMRAAAAPVVIGAQRYGPQGQPRNALALLTGAEGGIAHVYDKHRLVPFGEFMPLPRVADALGFGPLAARLAGRYAPGPGPETFAVSGLGRVLPLICYEAIFPQDLRRARPRADVVVHLTNDAWFGTGAGPRQHLALARLRAAESGLPVLRAANTGISAAIDARGGLRDTLPLNESGILDAPVPPALPETLHARTGDLPVLLVLLATGLGLIARRGVAGGGLRA